MPVDSKWWRQYRRWKARSKANQEAIERGFEKIDLLVLRGIKNRKSSVKPAGMVKCFWR